MPKPVLGFPSKKAAEANMLKIRDKYQKLEEARRPGDPHVRLVGEDAEWITSLLMRHAHADKIIGPGIDYHYVARDDQGSGNWGFRLVRKDGTEDVWGMRNALNGKQPSSETRAKQAFRDEVAVWVKKAGATYDLGEHGGRCFASGKPIIDNHDSELHHEGDWPFWRIVDEFMRDEFLGWNDIVVQHKKEGCRELVGVFQLADRALAARWVEHHAAHARIVRVLKGEHKEETRAEGERRRGSHYGKLAFPDSPQRCFEDGELDDIAARIARRVIAKMRAAGLEFVW